MTDAAEKYKLLFDEVAPVIKNTIPEEPFINPDELLSVFNRLQDSFTDDIARVYSYEELLVGDDISDYGNKVTDVFSAWDDSDHGPSLTAFAVFAIDKFNLDITNPVTLGLFTGAILAEIPNDLRYHGNEHYRKVVFHVIRLIKQHNNAYDATTRMLTHDHVALLVTSAIIHDLGHAGGDNLRDGIYAPGALEQYSCDVARPYFEAVGMKKDDIGEIDTIIFCTDLTFFAGENSPCVRMKKIYKFYFWEDDREDVSMMMMGKLRRFQDNPRLVLMGILLHEADIATSAGLSYAQTIKETKAIMEERGVPAAGPRTVIAFLREQLGETMFSDAARQIFGKKMATVIETAEKEIEEGRQSFYD